MVPCGTPSTANVRASPLVTDGVRLAVQQFHNSVARSLSQPPVHRSRVTAREILRSHPRRFPACLLRLLHAFLCSPVGALIIRTLLYDDEIVIAMNGNNIAIHGRRFIVLVLPFFIIQPVDEPLR